MEKNHGIWKNRPAVQKAFDADPQHAYNTVNAVITADQAAVIEAALCPPPSDEDMRSALESTKATLASLGVDTAAVDAKLAEMSATKGGR
jgi:hypothetical protein